MESKQIKCYLIVLSLIWGSSFILIKKGLIGLTAIQVGSLRIVFAAIFLLLIGFKSLSNSQREMEIYRFDFNARNFYSCFPFAIAQTEIDSSVSSILNLHLKHPNS
jgi:drug/metabolite transporter (DMT)-like permease